MEVEEAIAEEAEEVIAVEAEEAIVVEAVVEAEGAIAVEAVVIVEEVEDLVEEDLEADLQEEEGHPVDLGRDLRVE